jgi:hypothetical protein
MNVSVHTINMQPNACAIQKIKEDMAPGLQSGANGGGSPRRQNDLPPEIKEIIWPALQVGGLSGKLHFIFIFIFTCPSLRSFQGDIFAHP